MAGDHGIINFFIICIKTKDIIVVMKLSQIILASFVLLVLWNKSSGQLTGRMQDSDIKPFEATILNCDYSMAYADTLREISKIDLNNLKQYCSNPCMQDGSQITVVLKKGVSKNEFI